MNELILKLQFFKILEKMCASKDLKLLRHKKGKSETAPD